MDKRPNNSELATLLVRSGSGDRKAFADLYLRTSAKLFGIICRILTNRELAEEALQESYFRIWQRADSFDPAIASPISWMAAIARNRAIDIRRLGSERISARAEPPNEDLMSEGPDPRAETERNEVLRQLLICLTELSEESREMVLLAYLQGWSREEIGHKFARPVNTIKTVLRRSLALLKGCLDG